MTEQRNIVVLGASFAGIQAAQYITKHLIPALNARHSAEYHLYVINPSEDFYYRLGSPRTAISASRLPVETILVPLAKFFDPLPKSDFTFIQAAASGLDITDRTVLYKRGEAAEEETLTYHALIVATGSRTYHPAYSHYLTETTKAAITTLNKQISTAKSVIVVGGGPTGVETAAEIGEHLNGKPGWFSTPAPKVPITLITATDRLLSTLRPAIGKQAEEKLKKLGVEVRYGTRVSGTTEGKDGRTVISLDKGETLETDLYIPAHGVLPNSSFLPASLLDSSSYLLTNPSTLRVDAAGPLVYAFGDISSASRNTGMDVNATFPVLVVNLKRDLFAFDPKEPGKKAPGIDREYTPNTKETMVATIGSSGGVGAGFGWKLPNFLIWMAKSRDMMTGIALGGLLQGKDVAKEVPWKGQEVVV